jgi:DNA-binding CsgD family transcriptional regulator
MKDVLKEIKVIFGKAANNSADQELRLEVEIQKALLNIFHVGDYYYYVFNVKTSEFEFISPEIEKVLGYPPHTMNLKSFMESIHPEDVHWMLNFEARIVRFFSTLRTDQILKYKTRYDYRLRKKDGEYIRILQQVVTIQFDGIANGLLRTFGVHTDITFLKKAGRPICSLIGLGGEPSYIDIDVDKIFTASQTVITDREKQILHLIIEGESTKTIANTLSISSHTVHQHRKNLLRKTGSTNTAHLIKKAIQGGLI